MSKISRFAGLMGFGAKKAESDQDKDKSAEKPTQREDESDEDFEKRLKEWEDAQEDGESAENPKDTSDDDQDKVDGKAAKAAIDKARAEGHAAGVKAEKSRWDGVLASDAAKGKAITACSLLADTDMTAAAIQKTLGALPAETPARSTLAERTGGQPTPAPKTDGGEGQPDPKSPKGFAAGVAAAVAKVRGQNKAA